MMRPTSSQQFGPQFRLHSQSDFDRVYARRCSASDGVLLIFVEANDLPHARLGLSVSRKVGGAVLRNRWKRLLREAFRSSREALPPGVDIVALPRGGSPELAQLRPSLVRLANRAAKKLARG